MLCKRYYFKFLFFLDAFVCNISSPSYNTVEVSCKLLGVLARIHVTMICTSCTNTLNTTLDDSPVVFQNLSAGNYTVDITTVDIGNVSIMRTIEITDDAVTENTPTIEGTIMTNNCI